MWTVCILAISGHSWKRTFLLCNSAFEYIRRLNQDNIRWWVYRGESDICIAQHKDA